MVKLLTDLERSIHKELKLARSRLKKRFSRISLDELTEQLKRTSTRSWGASRTLSTDIQTIHYARGFLDFFTISRTTSHRLVVCF